MAKINARFTEELKAYGSDNFNACYNCGTCTAVCSLSTEKDSFPREMVRLSALGREDEILSSLKPWSCYYCGECSTHCPQSANPGELMMSLRRYLTARYDWTGFSGKLYKSLPVSLTAFVVVLLGVIYFAFDVGFDTETMLHFGHYFEMTAIGLVSLFILLPNVIRMWYFTIKKPGVKLTFDDYLKSSKELFIHAFTQKRALGCDDNQFRWFEHFVLVIAYLSLLFTSVFLDWFGAENLFVVVLGYVESLIILVVTVHFVSGRINKERPSNNRSQPSDWFFVIWLLLMGLTAFLVRLFIDLGMPEVNQWLYPVHLTVLVQWALIIVPFGKWTHFLYRSFAMYFAKLKEK